MGMRTPFKGARTLTLGRCRRHVVRISETEAPIPAARSDCPADFREMANAGIAMSVA
jgi:hypothetical protein